MKQACPYCGVGDVLTQETRLDQQTKHVRRRKVCESCRMAFITIEVPYDSLYKSMTMIDALSNDVKTQLFGPNYINKIERIRRNE